MTGRKPVLFVEIDGFEPTTLCLQSRCSSQLSYTPFFSFLFGDCFVVAKKTFKELVGAEGVEPPTLCL